MNASRRRRTRLFLLDIEYWLDYREREIQRYGCSTITLKNFKQMMEFRRQHIG